MRTSIPVFPSSSLFQDLDIERTVKEHDEQARSVFGGLMAHRVAGGEVRVRAGPDDVAVRVELTFQDDDRVRDGVPVEAAPRARRVADEMVLLAGCAILV